MKKRLLILSTIIIIIGIMILLPNTTSETYAASATLADTVIALKKGSSWSSGASGVYYTNSHEYRYVGADPNNWVKFNNELYRIIGVFDSNSHGVSGKNLVKLIRARKIGAYSWGTYNTSNTSGTYSSYKNDWAGTTTGVKTSLNVLLNEYFYKKTNSSSTYGRCMYWSYFYNSSTNRIINCSNIVGYGIDSSVRNYIQSVTWYLKGYNSNEYSKQNFYLCERGQSSDTTNCKSGNSGTYAASTTGYIGLMYVSDYLYASGYFSSSSTTVASSTYYAANNWLFNGYEWTITPDSDTADYAFYVYRSDVSSYPTYYGYGVSPVFYLKSTVYVTGGNGSYSNPYTIACDDCG